MAAEHSATGRGPGRPDWRPRRRGRVGGRANLLLLLPLVLLPGAFAQPPVGLAMRLGAFALLVLAAWLTREGLRAQEAFEMRDIARRPALPRKVLGAVAMGAGLALAAVQGVGAGEALIVGLLGAGLHLGAFGLDPMHEKGADAAGDRVERAVSRGETLLSEMRDAVRETGDRRLQARVDSFAERARGLFRLVEDDPRRLAPARRYLGVYLRGARDSARQYAALDRQRGDVQARRRFELLLDDLEADFAARTDQLLADDRDALDLEIDVLRERLRREGVEPE